MAFRYSPNIVTDGLVFAVDAANKKSYPGSGTTWKDLSGYGNDGTLVNGPTFDSGNGGSIVFDGTDDYVNCGNQSNLNNTLNISACAWVYPISNQVNNVNNIINRYFNSTSHNGWQLNFYESETTSDLSFGFGGRENNTLFIMVSSEYSYSYNNWYFVCGTKQGDTWNIYVNGLLQNSQNVGDGSIVFGNNTMYLGGFPHFDYYTNNKISYTHIYNRALSDTEITQNYNALKSRFEL